MSWPAAQFQYDELVPEWSLGYSGSTQPPFSSGIKRAIRLGIPRNHNIRSSKLKIHTPVHVRRKIHRIFLTSFWSSFTNGLKTRSYSANAFGRSSLCLLISPASTYAPTNAEVVPIPLMGLGQCAASWNKSVYSARYISNDNSHRHEHNAPFAPRICDHLQNFLAIPVPGFPHAIDAAFRPPA